MKVTMRNALELIPYKDNPRKINNYEFSGLCESLKKFGFQQPVVINTKNEILSGNQRTKAAIKLGILEIPTITVDLANKSVENAFVITMNNKNITGEFTEGLRDLLEEIKDDLDDDYIFDLNLDAVLKDLPVIELEEAPEEESEQEEPEIKEKLRIIIECSNTDEHSELFQELIERGLSVRVA